jgi:hypothetical protein
LATRRIVMRIGRSEGEVGGWPGLKRKSAGIQHGDKYGNYHAVSGFSFLGAKVRCSHAYRKTEKLKPWKLACAAKLH